MYYTYVLQSKKDGKWYTGFSVDLRKRLAAHNSGKVFSTKGRGPFIVVYYEACLNEFDARQRERYLKSGPGKRYLKNRLRRFRSLTGFTLVEVIIYVGIVSFILVALLAVADIVQSGRTRFLISNVTQVSAARVLNTIDALVRNADGFVETSAAAPCVFTNKLWLYFATSSQAYVPPGCLGDYSSGAVSIEPYHFSGATTTSPHSPRYAAEGYGFTADSKYLYSAGSLNNGWHISKRYLADLSYDTGFGTDGAVSVSGNDGARDTATDGQYLYIVGGYEADSTTNQARIEKRRLEDGSLVTSFGTEGFVTDTNAKIFNAIAIDSANMYLAGYKYNSGASRNDWLIEKRLLSTGALVTAFNTDGIIDNGFTDGKAYDIMYDSSNNRIYIVGESAATRITESRLTSDGSYDTSFDSDGYIQSSAGSTVASGPNSGGTFANDAGIGTIAWSSPSNASANDASRTQARILNAAASQYLKATNFGFAIPAGSTISGIVAEVDKSRKKPAVCFSIANAQDNGVKIVKGGTISGTEMAAAGNWPLTASEDYTTYGGSANLWGVTWTAADINASTFGLAISTISTNADSSVPGEEYCVDAEIDHIRLTVYYTTGGAYRSVTMDASGTYLYATGDNGSDLIVGKVNRSNGSVDSGFGTSGIATAASATTAGYGIDVRGDYLYVAGHSSNDWYLEKRSLVDGSLASGFPIAGSSATDVPYGGLYTDENFLYTLGTTVISGTRYQYIEKRFLGNGAYAEHNGVRLWCYQDYPNRGLASSCAADPLHSGVSRMDLTDPLQLFVGLTDLTFTTTTAGSRDGVETLLDVRYLGDTGMFGIATVTASSTASFRIDP